ncbi:RNA polymerase sigma factor [Nakamurella alba]|uniref:RNA polymerase sigma factor n=1 Tax=Nakamurella alba TaxID=2665158 RepID=UPI0018AC2BB0|nr:RNA polymerase sigma factor [Nakamurella alba]
MSAQGVAVDTGPFEDPAFAAWVRPHLAVLSGLAVREVGPADAEDLVQETLLRAWQRRSSYRATRGSERTFLVMILLDKARRARTRAHRDPDQPLVHTGPVDADGVDLERAIAALPDRQRQVVTLHYLADLPVQDVARLLGISPGSVKSSLFDARAALRPLLEEQP